MSASGFFPSTTRCKNSITMQSDENMSTEDEVQNKFYSYTNSSKLCAEGAIVNLMNVLKCSDLAHKNKSHGHSLYISIPPFPIKYSPPHILLCHHPFIRTKLHKKINRCHCIVVITPPPQSNYQVNLYKGSGGVKNSCPVGFLLQE